MINWIHLNFLNPNSNITEEIIYLHDTLIILSTLILTLVAYFIVSTLNEKGNNISFNLNHLLELAWTSSPLIILIIMATPSIILLYQIEESSPSLTVSVSAHQWYWTYEYPEINIENDSYISHSPSIRLLSSDSPILSPQSLTSRLLVTSEDVIHSWAMPPISINVDAIPGRINQLSISPSRPGVFFGQCSEICGANHSFIPIILEVITPQNIYNVNL